MNEGLVGLFGAVGRGGIKSIQRGVVASFNTQNSPEQTVSKVDPAKSVLLITGVIASAGATAQEMGLLPMIVSSESIRFDGWGTPSSLRSVAWTLIEYA